MEQPNSNKKKRFIIAGLSAFCIVLVIGIFIILNGEREKSELPIAYVDTNNSVSVGEIDKENEIESPQPSINSEEIKVNDIQVEDAPKANDIQLTEIPEKPEPPEKPDGAVNSEKPHETPKNPELTDPNKKPAETVKPVEPTKPKEDTPKGGDTNSKGEVYVPGFGWVQDSGSNEGTSSQSDGDWNKQIGDMN